MKYQTLILIAMQSEANPLIKKLNLSLLEESPLDPKLPFRIYHNTEKGLVLMVAGIHPKFDNPWIGSQAATLMTWEGIRCFNPKQIINAGTAGGVNTNELKIGQIVVATRAVYCDRRMEMPSFATYAKGDFLCHSEKADADHVTGIVATGSSFSASELDRAIMKKYGAIAVDMELAAITEVAYLKNIPVTALKIVGNYIDPETKPAEVFETTLDNMAEKLSDAVVRMLNRTVEKNNVIKPKL